ncbi:MAG: hypothetical protein AB3X44_15345 [Leptothrix sp. (in: b-proteobacteria)]
MKALITVAAAVLLTACASSGVVQTDRDTYMVAMKNTGGVFGNIDKVKVDAYREAGEFCAKDGKVVETVSTTAEGAVPFVRMGGASVTFKCVKP